MIHLIPSIMAFLGTFLCLMLGYNFAVSINLVARPDNRKLHQGAVPLIGGIAVVFGLYIACLLSPRSLTEWRPLFLCLLPLTVIGIMDDHGDISIRKRISVQIVTCLVMIYHGNIKINSFGDLTGLGFNVTFKGMESVVTIICVVGVINALNLIDGINGLCASICLITLCAILILVKMTGATASVSLILYFCSGLVAFLIVNLGLAERLVKKVFLGDAGTTVIGFFLCWFLISMSDGTNAVFRPITAVWLLSLPIMDTLLVIINRVKSRKSPFQAGRTISITIC